MGVLKGPSPLRLAKALTSLAHSSMSPLFFFFSPPSLLFQLLALLFVFQSSVDFVRKCAKISESAFAGCLIFERDRDESEEEVEDRVVCVGFCFLFPFSVTAQLLFSQEKNVQRRKSKHPHPVLILLPFLDAWYLPSADQTSHLLRVILRVRHRLCLLDTRQRGQSMTGVMSREDWWRYYDRVLNTQPHWIDFVIFPDTCLGL